MDVRYVSSSKPMVVVQDPPKLGKLEARNKEQKFALNLLLDPSIKFVTLAGQAGTGKAQPLSAKVVTPSGWTTMGKLSVGDKVIGQSGKPITVLGVYPQGIKDIYEITFSDGAKTRSCKEHLWETSNEYERFNRKSSVKTLEKISETLLGHDKRKNHSIPLTREVCFEHKKVPLDPYFLGVLLGDGGFSIKGRVSLSNADKELIEKVQQKMPETDLLVKVKSRKYDYSFKNKIRTKYQCTTVTEINKLNLSGTYSHTKFIPDVYKYNDIQTRKEILQGLIDTDGYVCKKGTSAEFYSTSYQLAMDVKEIVSSLGGVATINSKQTKYTYLGKKLNGKPSWVVRMSFNGDFCPASLSRKTSRWVRKEKYVPVRYITEVKYVGKEEARCILVDSPDHLYLKDYYIVTHNTLASIAAGLDQVLDRKKYKNLVVLRPIQPVGKDIGYLPGSLQEKLEPWIAPIKDNLRFLLSGGGKRSKNVEDTLNYYFDDGTIEIEALTFIRGRSIANAFIIIDEAQNLNAHELKTIITRVGEGTKIVLTGDIEQIDNTYVDSLSNGLTVAIEKFKDYTISGHVTLCQGERSELASLAAKIL
mgnify:FL=1